MRGLIAPVTGDCSVLIINSVNKVASMLPFDTRWSHQPQKLNVWLRH